MEEGFISPIEINLRDTNQVERIIGIANGIKEIKKKNPFVDFGGFLAGLGSNYSQENTMKNYNLIVKAWTSATGEYFSNEVKSELYFSQFGEKIQFTDGGKIDVNNNNEEKIQFSDGGKIDINSNNDEKIIHRELGIFEIFLEKFHKFLGNKIGVNTNSSDSQDILLGTFIFIIISTIILVIPSEYQEMYQFSLIFTSTLVVIILLYGRFEKTIEQFRKKLAKITEKLNETVLRFLVIIGQIIIWPLLLILSIFVTMIPIIALPIIVMGLSYFLAKVFKQLIVKK